MGFGEEIESTGKNWLGAIVSDVEAGGIGGLQNLESVSGIEAELEKTFPGQAQTAAPTADTDDTDQTQDATASDTDDQN